MSTKLDTTIRKGDLVKFPSGATGWPKYLHGRVTNVSKTEVDGNRLLCIDRLGQHFEVMENHCSKLYEDITPFRI